MRRSNCAGASQYVPELTWILFLCILDETEEREASAAEALGLNYTLTIDPLYRWRDWAAPDGAERCELQNAALGSGANFQSTSLPAEAG